MAFQPSLSIVITACNVSAPVLLSTVYFLNSAQIMSPFRLKQHVLSCGARKRVFAFQMVFPVSSADASLANHSMNSIGFSAKTAAKWQIGRHIAISVGALSQSGLHRDIAGLIYTHIRRKIGSIPCSKSTYKQQ